MPSDSFGTFLESLGRESQAVGAVDRLSTVSRASDQLLTTIARDTVRRPQELMGSSGLSVVGFSEALADLRAAGLVTVESDAGEDVLELTPAGAERAHRSG